MLVAPSEPAVLRALGTYSPFCEQWGCDFLIPTTKGWAGVQRKETSDLVASVRGDRFGRELSQIAEAALRGDLVTAILLVEGRWFWDDPFGRDNGYTKAELRGLILSVQSRGIWVVTTDSLEETADFLVRLPVWLGREEHESLLRVPKQRGVSQAERMLMAVDGVSLVRARALIEHFGKLPAQWSCTLSEIKAVPGIGPVTAKRIYEALNG